MENRCDESYYLGEASDLAASSSKTPSRTEENSTLALPVLVWEIPPAAAPCEAPTPQGKTPSWFNLFGELVNNDGGKSDSQRPRCSRNHTS